MAKHELDKHFGRYGPCMLHPTRYSRHRLTDAIRGRYKAGDSVKSLMADYQLSRAAILAAINSTPDDNRMTKKEVREGRAEWERTFGKAEGGT